MQSLVVGNGESRNLIDLNAFSKDHILIGCNALHRDLIVDHLVCCDRRMVEEAVESPNTSQTKIYAREDWFKYYRKIKKDRRIHQVPQLPYQGELKQDQPTNWGSGTYAVLLAAGISQSVSLIGFDLYPVNDKINNIYKDTNNYGKKDSKPVDYSYWEYQIGRVFQYHPNINFTIFNTVDWKMPRQWNKSNVSFGIINSLTSSVKESIIIK